MEGNCRKLLLLKGRRRERGNWNTFSCFGKKKKQFSNQLVRSIELKVNTDKMNLRFTRRYFVSIYLTLSHFVRLEFSECVCVCVFLRACVCVCVIECAIIFLTATCLLYLLCDPLFGCRISEGIKLLMSHYDRQTPADARIRWDTTLHWKETRFAASVPSWCVRACVCVCV